ncbi:hypothetical protein FRC07_004527 [Ceratobasidium sp. 392]|nr:hypothetical protein FRC07_004527 [Ceratobasidium sp. 392]
MVPDADARQKTTLRPFLIAQLCFFLTVYLALNPRLFHLRLWFLPVALHSLWHLCTNFAFKDPTLNSYNFGICSVGPTMAIQLVQLAMMRNLTSSRRDTIFRDTFAITANYTLHLPHPFLGALPVTVATGFLVMNTLAIEHYLITLLVAPWTSTPASSLKKEWPPLFDRPSRATSLRDFWTNRWQGSTRRYFAFAGGRPGQVLGEYTGRLVGRDKARVIGSRVGYVMGTFIVSGLIHDFGTWGMGQGMDLRRVTGYFALQGVGVVVESALGLDRKEGGLLRKVWVPLWVVLPATMMVEAWIKRGFAFVSNSYSPSVALLNMWNEFAFGK